MGKKSGWLRDSFKDKTAWDWLQLFIQLLAAIALPVVLSLAAQGFSAQQSQVSQQIAADQQRETTLKTCLDDIKDLLLNKSLRVSKPQDEVRVVARGEVLVALRQLDGVRKGLLMQFLDEAGLITSDRNDTIISLFGADLSKAPLFEIDLSGTTLDEADLRGADLSGGHLRGAHLNGAYLNGADLFEADLRGANLSDTSLGGANLGYAYLMGADLTVAQLDNADLHGARLRDTELGDANLSGADLSGADLRGADLRGTTLDKTILEGARYNTKEILLKDEQGKINGKWPPTQWPKGFDPKAAGVTEDNTDNTFP